MKLLMITRKVDRGDAHAGFTYQWINEFAHQLESISVVCLEKGDITGLPDNCKIYSLDKHFHEMSKFLDFDIF